MVTWFIYVYIPIREMVTGIHRENDGPIGLKGDQAVGTKV